MSVDPAGRVAVPLDFHVLPERLRAHGTPLVQENSNLAQDPASLSTALVLDALVMAVACRAG